MTASGSLKKGGIWEVDAFQESPPIGMRVHQESPALPCQHCFIKTPVVLEPHSSLRLGRQLEDKKVKREKKREGIF